MSLGANLLQLRRAAKLTQEGLAERAGVQQSDISKWEKETVRPDLTSALKIAAALRCSLDKLLQGLDAQYDTSRDLLGHGRTKGSALLPSEGESDVPDQAREIERLRSEIARYDALVGELQNVTSKLVSAAAHRAQGAATPRSKTARRSRYRKTG